MELDGQDGAIQELISIAGTVGTPGLVALFVLLIMTGKLVPRRVHEDRIADKDKVLQAQAEYIKALKVNNDLLREGTTATVAVTRATAQALEAPHGLGITDA